MSDKINILKTYLHNLVNNLDQRNSTDMKRIMENEAIEFENSLKKLNISQAEINEIKLKVARLVDSQVFIDLYVDKENREVPSSAKLKTPWGLKFDTPTLSFCHS
jgi:hypothetical protein